MNKGLTSVRSAAFMGIFFYHANIFPAGVISLQAFFVLSGFLITPILLEMKASLSTRDLLINFTGRRALRIFPIYFVYLLLVYLLLSYLVAQPWYKPHWAVTNFFDGLPWALTYTYDVYHASHLYEFTPFLTHTWSLAVEEQFYLVWPLLLLVTPAHRVKALLLFLIAFGFVFRLVFSLALLNGWLPWFNENVEIAVFTMPFSHIDAFAIGAYFAVYGKSYTSASCWWLLLPVAIGFGLGMADWPYRYIWIFTLMNAVFGYLIIHIRDGKFLPIIFENAVMHYLGKISYGMYLFHFSVLGMFLILVPEAYFFLGLAGAFVVTALLSTISFYCIESPLMAKKDVLFPKHGRKPVLEAA